MALWGSSMRSNRLQFRTALWLIVLLYVGTFCVVLPIFCRNRPFSRYYLKSSRTVGGAIANDVTQGQRADDYFERLDSESSLAFHTRPLKQPQSSPPKYAIGVITVKRKSSHYKKYDPRYLSRVVGEFDRLLKAAERRDVVLFVCNAESVPSHHSEAERLAKYVPVVNKRENAPRTSDDAREQEKRDYIFCMSSAETFNAEYSVLVQDDALPYPQFLVSLDRLLDTRFKNKMVRSRLVPSQDTWAAVKFYFPEKWQGYGKETFLVTELLAAAIFGGGILHGLFRFLTGSDLGWLQTFCIFTLLCVFFGALIFVIGRPYLLMLRRLSVDLYSVRGAPDCCIPAVLYRTESLPRIREHLQGITCSKKHPLDIEISQFLHSVGVKQYLVMPNLFNHIGMVSSLHNDVNSPHSFLS